MGTADRNQNSEFKRLQNTGGKSSKKKKRLVLYTETVRAFCTQKDEQHGLQTHGVKTEVWSFKGCTLLRVTNNCFVLGSSE